MVRVSEIQPYRGSRVRIVLDDGTAWVVTKAALRSRPLQVEDLVDPEEFSRWIVSLQYRPALERAVSMLAARSCSRGEIRQKLVRSQYASPTVEKVMEKLETNGLLDDQAFADQWTRYRASQRYGPRQIQWEMRRKGVSPEDQAAALESFSEEEQLATAVSFVKKRLPGLNRTSSELQQKQRLIQALVRRGYDWDLARQAVESVLQEDE